MENKDKSEIHNNNEEMDNELKEMTMLLEKFDNVKYVLTNAALVAALLHYLFNKSQEYFSLLYYYTVQKYHKVIEIKNSMRNYNHINMEIYTIFIHPKAILQIPLNNEDIIKEIEDHIDTQDCIHYFTKASEWIVNEVIHKYLSEFRDALQEGLVKSLYAKHISNENDRIKEIKYLEVVHHLIQTTIIANQKSRCLRYKKNDFQNQNVFSEFQISAIVQALNTQYEFFIFDRKYSYILKHPENMLIDKTFFSTSVVKSSNKQRIKNHYFEEYSLPRVAFCFVCDIILWGAYPHCLYCRFCKKVIHRECKDMVENCQIEMKKNKKNDYNSAEIEKKKSEEEYSFDENPTINIECAYKSDQSTLKRRFSNELNYNVESDKIQHSKIKSKPFRKKSFSMFQDIKRSVTNGKVRKNSMKFFNNDWDLKRPSIIIMRSESVGSLCDENISSSTLNKSPNSEEEEQTFDAFTDDELNVPEIFDPTIEVQYFSNIINKSTFVKDGEYERLLVLMEFHHKIKFIRMYLRRIKCVFVDPWMLIGECMELFESLSLNCIEKLYTLIGSLVNVVDICKGTYSYTPNIAEQVLCWLSEEENNNLQRWLQLSINLYCTNILNSVKADCIVQKQMSAKFSDLLSKEINRMRIIGQLSNMRSLLFNLPMIVTKIVKDLERFEQFRDEAKIWGQIGQKLSRLPQLIEIRCMPVVQLVNNGTIISSSLKYKSCKHEKHLKREMESYINNFPKTIFKNNFIDFQLVKISNLRESYERELKLKYSTVYVRDEMEVAAICYDKKLILLQKENEKYLLKQFKSPDANKLFPMIPFNQIHATKQTIKEKKQFQHELTILSLDPAILLKLNFNEEESRNIWFNHITKRSNKIQKEISSENQTSSFNSTFSESLEYEDSDNRECDYQSNIHFTESKVSTIQISIKETVSHLQQTFDLIANELSTDEGHNEKTEETVPNSPNVFLYEYIDILKRYTTAGSHMINQGLSINTNKLITDEAIFLQISNLTAITKDMMTLLKYQKIDTKNENSDNSSIDSESIDQEPEMLIQIQNDLSDIEDDF